MNSGRVAIESAPMSPAMRWARNYYAWIAQHFYPILGQRVLDVGTGYGVHLPHVLSSDRFVMSVELSEILAQDLNRRFGAPGRYEARVADFTDPETIMALLPLSFDTIICMNFLEHVEDDARALFTIHSLARRERGHVFVLVPACPFLYGAFDHLAGHYRRYSRSGLERKLERAGFTVRRLFFFNILGLVPWWINGRLLRPRSLGSSSVAVQIALFDRYVVPIMRRLETAIPPPLGQSLIAIARAN